MKVIEVSRPWWAILGAWWMEVQLSPSRLHTQPQALIATDTPRQLDATGARSWVRGLAEKQRKPCTGFITMAWPSTWETGSTPQAEDQKAADCGRVWDFHTTFCATARSHPPFVPCRTLHYKQANDFQVHLGTWARARMQPPMFPQVTAWHSWSFWVHFSASPTLQDHSPLVQSSHEPPRTLIALCFLYPKCQ